MGPAESVQRLLEWGRDLVLRGPHTQGFDGRGGPISVQETWRAGYVTQGSLAFPHLVNDLLLQMVPLPSSDINYTQVPFGPQGNFICLEFITIVSTTLVSR